MYLCKFIVCMLIIDKSHLDEKRHGLWSRERWLNLVSLLTCDTVIDAAVYLTGLSWGVNKAAHAKCSIRLVHSRCSVKGRFRQWDPVAKWQWFWILKLQLNFQEHFSSEYRGHNYKAFSKKINPLKRVELMWRSQQIYMYISNSDAHVNVWNDHRMIQNKF